MRSGLFKLILGQSIKTSWATIVQSATKTYHTSKIIFIFIILHFLAWSIVPALVRLNLPLDAIEGTIWAHQLQWGYDKNPFLNGWLTALAIYLNAKGLLIYSACQLSVAAALFAVWLTARKFLNNVSAAISVLILETIQYFNFHAIDFNDNTLELGLWAVTIFCFFTALQKQTYRWWLAVGLSAGLCLMAKYYTLALLTCMTLFMFFNKEARLQLQKPGPYCAILLFLIIIFPHIIWLFNHDFVSVNYVFERASSEPSWTNHLFFPVQFAWQQFEVFLPAFLLLSILCLTNQTQLVYKKMSPVFSVKKQFILFIFFGPFLITLMLSFLLGIKLRAGWGMPLLSFWGLGFLYFVQPKLSRSAFHLFCFSIFIIMFTLLTAYSFSLLKPNTPTTANFPGQIVADKITDIWHKQYHTKLDYVAGSRWVGGNIGFYSKDKPAVFVEWNEKHAPWIDLADLKQKGGVFVWSITDDEFMPDEVRKAFPILNQSKILKFNWLRGDKDLKPIEIGMAILPPASTG